MDACIPPEQYYVCTANAYDGCCAENPCGEPEATCPCSGIKSSTAEASLTITEITASSTDSTDMGGLTTPDPPTFNTAVISAPLSLTGIPTSLITAPPWTSSSVSTLDIGGPDVPSTPWTSTSSLNGGVLSQISIAENSVPKSPNVLSTVSTESVSVTSSSSGSFPSGSTAPSSPSSSSSGAIAGGLVGSLVGALLVSFRLYWLCRHRRTRSRRQHENEKTDIVVQTLFDVPPSETIEETGVSSASTDKRRKIDSGIFAFTNRLHTTGGSVETDSGASSKEHTIDGGNDAALGAVDDQYAMGDTAEATSEVHRQQHTPGLQVETNSDSMTNRHTISGESSVRFGEANKRHTSG